MLKSTPCHDSKSDGRLCYNSEYDIVDVSADDDEDADETGIPFSFFLEPLLHQVPFSAVAAAAAAAVRFSVPIILINQ